MIKLSFLRSLCPRRWVAGIQKYVCHSWPFLSFLRKQESRNMKWIDLDSCLRRNDVYSPGLLLPATHLRGHKLRRNDIL